MVLSSVPSLSLDATVPRLSSTLEFLIPRRPARPPIRRAVLEQMPGLLLGEQARSRVTRAYRYADTDIGRTRSRYDGRNLVSRFGTQRGRGKMTARERSKGGKRNRMALGIRQQQETLSFGGRRNAAGSATKTRSSSSSLPLFRRLRGALIAPVPWSAFLQSVVANDVALNGKEREKKMEHHHGC